MARSSSRARTTSCSSAMARTRASTTRSSPRPRSRWCDGSDLGVGRADARRDLVEHRKVEPVHARRVLREDLANLVLRDVVERVVERLATVGPAALVVRVVGTPQHVVDADLVPELRFVRSEEHRLDVALAAPVLARPQLQALLLVLEHVLVH